MKAISLISGGFDSAVSSYILKEKFDIVGLHFSLEPITDNQTEKKSLGIAKKLGIEKLYVVKAGKYFAEISKKCNQKFYFVLSKRFMIKVAEEIAKIENSNVIVTGENLAQVSSQTLTNLSNIQRATDLELIRPLLCYDKNEIIDFAREIGTFEISKGPEICDLLGPKHPATKSDIKVILEEEKKLNMNEMVKKAVENAKAESFS